MSSFIMVITARHQSLFCEIHDCIPPFFFLDCPLFLSLTPSINFPSGANLLPVMSRSCHSSFSTLLGSDWLSDGVLLWYSSAGRRKGRCVSLLRTQKKRNIPLIIPPTPYSATVAVAVHTKRPHVAEETGIAARIISSLL